MPTKAAEGRVGTVYAFIKPNRKQHSVQEMCRLLGVAPSGYYDWLKQPLSNRAHEEARRLKLIRASFVASHGSTARHAYSSISGRQAKPAVSTASLVSCASISSVRCMAIVLGGWRSARRPS